MTERGYQAARRLAVDPGATPAERDNAKRRCAEHEATHKRPRAKRPPVQSRVRLYWWQLRIAFWSGPLSGKWLGPNKVFRDAIRSCQYSTDSWTLSFYVIGKDSRRALQLGLIDWHGFPFDEPKGWRPSDELREWMRLHPSAETAPPEAWSPQ